MSAKTHRDLRDFHNGLHLLNTPDTNFRNPQCTAHMSPLLATPEGNECSCLVCLQLTQQLTSTKLSGLDTLFLPIAVIFPSLLLLPHAADQYSGVTG